MSDIQTFQKKKKKSCCFFLGYLNFPMKMREKKENYEVRIGFKKNVEKKRKKQFNDTFYLHMSDIPNFQMFQSFCFPCISKFSRKKRKKVKGKERKG